MSISLLSAATDEDVNALVDPGTTAHSEPLATLTHFRLTRQILRSSSLTRSSTSPFGRFEARWFGRALRRRRRTGPRSDG